jgi:hypothetical protein
MSFWNYIVSEKYKLAANAAVATVGFFFAFIGNSYVDDWKERKTFLTTLAAIKSEAASNGVALKESFVPLYMEGIVLREFSTGLATQALSNPAFIKHASTAQLQVLTQYVRDLTLANAYRSKVESIRFNADYFAAPKNSTLKQWESQLLPSWTQNLVSCQASIHQLGEL